MTRIVIFGNSGSGKSTLAKSLADQESLPMLDLDTITWRSPGVRRDLAPSISALDDFLRDHDRWVIEGCYVTLARHASVRCTDLIFLDPGAEVCRAHTAARPWEPHKYPSKAAQDEKLEFLQQWVLDYYERDDETSHAQHSDLYASFGGTKRRLVSPGAYR